MANTRIGYINLLETATLQNDSGGGAPTSDELSPYVVDNVQVADRYTVWRSSNAPAATVYADFDLGSNKTVTAAAILGYRSNRAANGLAVSNIEVFSAASASGYLPGAWTSQGSVGLGTMVNNPRDAGIDISSVSHRYWRFAFTTTGYPFSIGRLWLGNPSDLGAICSPGGTHRPFRNRLETPLPGGAIVVNELGDAGATWQMPWNVISSSTRDTLLSLHDQTTGVLMIDADGDFFEVIAREGSVQVVRRSTVTYDASFELMRLP